MHALHLVDPVAAGRLDLRLIVEADPGLPSRLLEPFAKRGLVPDRFVLRRQGAVLAVEIGAGGLDDGVPALISAALAQMVGVVAVGAG